MEPLCLRRLISLNEKMDELFQRLNHGLKLLAVFNARGKQVAFNVHQLETPETRNPAAFKNKGIITMFSTQLKCILKGPQDT